MSKRLWTKKYLTDLNMIFIFSFISSLESQEKEYKEALDAFNEKNKEKAQLVTKLMEVRISLLV